MNDTTATALGIFDQARVAPGQMLSSNAKFGGPSFSVLPQDSCIKRGYATDICMARCYVPHMYLDRPYTFRKMQRNFPRSQHGGFTFKLALEIEHARVGDIRIHAGGDFAEPAAVDDWCAILDHTPQVRYLCFTRAYLDDEFILPLTRLARKPNMNLWLSLDANTGSPKGEHRIPNTKMVWLATHDGEHPPFRVDLIFRATAERISELYTTDVGKLRVRNQLPVIKQMNGSPVCFKETGAPKMPKSCITCRFCMFHTG